MDRRREQPLKSVVSIRAEALVCDRQQSAGSVERIVAAAAVTERVVLHAAADLVEDPVRELDQMERIRDLGGVREHRVEHAAIRTRQIQRRPSDRRQPLLGPLREPGARPSRVTASDDVEQLAVFDIDDLGRPVLRAEPAEPAEQHLIETDRGRGADPVRVVDQRCAVTINGIHHRVPVTTEIRCDLADAATVEADLERRPPPRPIRDRRLR